MLGYMAYQARYREVLLLTGEELVSGRALASYLRNQKDLLREPLLNDHVAIMVDTWQQLMRVVECSEEFKSGVVWGKTSGADIVSALRGVMEHTNLPELVNLQVVSAVNYLIRAAKDTDVVESRNAEKWSWDAL